MKESIGATWIFTICVTFIVLFTAYIAISVNYAKAFRLKSHIVSEIEEHEGISDLGLQDELQTYLTAQGYSTKGECPNKIIVNGQETGWGLKWCLLGDDEKGTCGACVYQMPVAKGNDNLNNGKNRYYYRVTTFFKFDLPVVNVVLPPFSISGDTQYIMEK